MALALSIGSGRATAAGRTRRPGDNVTGMPQQDAPDPPAARPEPADPDAALDAAALARVAHGDEAAFRALVARHLSGLLVAGRRVLGDSAESEDVAQEALLRLWRNASNIEVGPGGLRPWLRRVVVNLAIDRMRARRRVSPVDELPEVPTRARQEDGLQAEALTGRVRGALATLPERQRQALALFHFEGLSQIEVGRAMGVSDEAVESLLARARRALKAALKDDWRALLPDEQD